MENFNLVLTGIAAILIALNIGSIIAKRYQSKKEDAETLYVKVESDSVQVKTAKEVVELVQMAMGDKDSFAKSILVRLDNAEIRIGQLETREAKYLERITRYQAYVLIAYTRGLKLDPMFPAPPFLITDDFGDSHELPLT